MKPILILLLAIVAATTTLLTTTPIQVQATTGMSGEPHGGGQDNPQPDRVGAGDDNEDGVQDTPRDGPGGDDATGDDTGEENCWGKVTSDAEEHLIQACSDNMHQIQPVMQTEIHQEKALEIKMRAIQVITPIVSDQLSTLTTVKTVTTTNPSYFFISLRK